MPIKSTPPVRKRSANLAQGVVEALTQRIQLGNSSRVKNCRPNPPSCLSMG